MQYIRKYVVPGTEGKETLDTVCDFTPKHGAAFKNGTKEQQIKEARRAVAGWNKLNDDYRYELIEE